MREGARGSGGSGQESGGRRAPGQGRVGADEAGGASQFCVSAPQNCGFGVVATAMSWVVSSVGRRFGEFFVEPADPWHATRLRMMEIITNVMNPANSLLSIAALLLIPVSASAAVVDLGSLVSRTPYEAYMSPVKQVFSSINGQAPAMDRVAALMRQGRGFRYSHTDSYNPALPRETAAHRVGDCKDKALWLCDQLQDPTARFVIGKIKRSSRINHAWVLWQGEGRWWILDCTMNAAAVPLDTMSPDAYVPLYSYSKNAAFRHTGSTGMGASGAGRTQSPAPPKVPVAARRERLAAN